MRRRARRGRIAPAHGSPGTALPSWSTASPPSDWASAASATQQTGFGRSACQSCVVDLGWGAVVEAGLVAGAVVEGLDVVEDDRAHLGSGGLVERSPDSPSSPGGDCGDVQHDNGPTDVGDGVTPTDFEPVGVPCSDRAFAGVPVVNGAATVAGVDETCRGQCGHGVGAADGVDVGGEVGVDTDVAVASDPGDDQVRRMRRCCRN